MPVTVKCLNCRKEFQVPPSKIEKRRFCSKRCFYEFRRKRVNKICQNCGKEFEVWQSRRDKAKFCSHECRLDYDRKTSVKIKRICQGCGKEFYIFPYRVKRGEGKFCSKKCASVNISQDLLFTAYWDLELSVRDCAKIFRCSATTIRQYLKKYHIPLRELGGVADVNLKPSKELAYILGVIFGDGYVGHTKKYGDRFIQLKVIDKQFADEFVVNLRRIGLKPYMKTIKPKKPNWKKIYYVRARSKQFYEWYKSLDLKTIETEYLINDDFRKEFIRGFYESEGHRAHSNIQMYNTNLKLLKLIKAQLEKLGFKVSIKTYTRRNRKPEHVLTVLGGKKEVLRFIQIINPITKN
ncbi:LAGLIDADG family homing endonuclease [Geoglobus acetivorans]|uniref:DOD-type homing endonuclease domain-containing protein n=1 Tax=Geoglobus acetivorans TaxID=565033 RepID=A0ABZ3H422_GEOAI|nr:hypothetical protein [Geoglobus acetivorans]